MNGGTTLINGNGTTNGLLKYTPPSSSAVVASSQQASTTTTTFNSPDPIIDFPQTKDELNQLLGRYYKLLKTSHQFKQDHEAKVEALKELAQANGDLPNNITHTNNNDTFSADSASDEVSNVSKDNSNLESSATPSSSVDYPPFIDPTERERLLIEEVLYKVSSNQDEFLAKQQQFYDELLTTEIEAIENTDDESFDFDLFTKQITGLQLLSKDYDLSESLQSTYTNETKSSPSIDIDTIIKKLSSFESTDFISRAKLLGIKIPQSLSDLNPFAAPIGSYYTDKILTNKISNRLRELENLPGNLGTFEFNSIDNHKVTTNDSLKIKALIELKSLRLLSKQKQLKRNILIHEANQSKYILPSLMNDPICLQEKRSFNIRSKIEQSNPQYLAIQLEELKKQEARELKRQLHISKINQVLESALTSANDKYQKYYYRSNTLVKQISNFHQNTEKDESKKLERTAKQRLQALKSNDEEAYMKLLDQTKDHRITHLLKQTNQFLDTLANQVKAQQEEYEFTDKRDVPPEIMPEPKQESVGEDGEVKDENEDLREKIDYYQVAHRIKEEVNEQPNILVGGKLKEYQLKGLQWMVSLYNNKLNGILADEMGLGKTIQSISLITYLIEKKQESKFLVIVPLSTITNWTMEFEKWAPSVRVIVYKGSQQQRRSLQHEVRLGNFQVMLTTYEYIIRERPLLSKFHYSHMIIDEGHRMKNATSKLSITLKQYYRTKNRLILTGTPLQNNLPELWALLNFVLPRIFNSVKSFDEWFNTPFANTGAQEKIELTEEESLLVIRRLHKVLRPFLLRRLKKDVEKDLPDKVEKVLKCNLSGLQYILYQQMLKHNALFVGADVGGAKSGIKGLNNKIMQLRKICNHPFVFEEVEGILNSSRLTNDLIWRTSGKFELLDRILPKFKASGHRVLMFFQMTQVMDIMEDFLRWCDMKYLRLDGSTKADDRQDMLKAFNAPNSEYFCFLLSTRAGGLGLNLQTADTVVIFDTDWNPHQDLQAQDRAHRIGQKNEVRILRLITNDSVEEVILERAHQKLDIDGKVIQAGKFDNKSTAEEQEEYLKRLLEADARGGENEENDSLDDEELNEILARSEEETVLFAKIDAERKKHDKNLFKTRLIEQSELPPVFTEDISKHFEKKVEDIGRKRDKKRVKYDDGLTEEQWLMAMDDDNDTVEDAIKRKEQRISKRKKNKAVREGLIVEEIGDDEVGEEDDDEDDDEEYGNSSRKRQRRSTSRTPQPSTKSKGKASKFVVEDDDEVEDEEDEEEPVEDEIEDDGPVDELTQQCNQVLAEIEELVADDGHAVAEIFIKLPSRKLYPDYYSIIKHPVSINQIKKQLEQGKIEDFEHFKSEVKQMCINGKTYNEEGSFVYSDADIIEKLIDSKN